MTSALPDGIECSTPVPPGRPGADVRSRRWLLAVVFAGMGLAVALTSLAMVTARGAQPGPTQVVPASVGGATPVAPASPTLGSQPPAPPAPAAPDGGGSSS